MTTEINIEYCLGCGYVRNFNELAEKIKINNPNIKIVGTEGREASFEVKVNDTLIHSRLSTLAFPDYADVADIISDAVNGQPIRLAKQQPIKECSVM